MGSNHLVIIDPIYTYGGSKVATENILRLLDEEKLRITVLTANPSSWQYEHLHTRRLYEPKWLANKIKGSLYFVRHFFIALQLLLLRFRLGKIDLALGASGPGIDLSLYLLKSLLKYKIIQLVHGTVAQSRTVGHALKGADEVYHLNSAYDSLLASINRVSKEDYCRLPPNFRQMINGLSEHNWPQPCQYQTPAIFWAASLLKWKGLDTLISALQIVEPVIPIETHICYIKPEQDHIPTCKAPVIIQGVHWHNSPDNLDQIRAGANIFVSTSENEPFGLSILEAMAAGHCVFIPDDNSYWAQHLTDGINCIKYKPGSPDNLVKKLTPIIANLEEIRRLGNNAMNIARQYRASIQYQSLKNSIENLTNLSADSSVIQSNRRLIND